MIYETSRYENARLLRIIAADGTLQPAVYQAHDFDRQVFDFFDYTTKEGDRLDLLADRFYDDPEQWWRVARANPELFYPEDLPSGVVIRVPYA